MTIWRLTEFAGVPLPAYNVSADLTGGRAESPLLDTVSGVYDTRSGRRVVPRRAQITLQGIYASEIVTPVAVAVWVTGDGNTLVTGGGDRLVFAPAIAGGGLTTREQLTALQALRGRTGALLRVATDDSGVVQRIDARLLEVRPTARSEWHGALVMVDALWEATGEPYWYVNTLRTASGLTLNANVNGNAPVRDAKLTITGPVASSCTVAGSGHNLTWTGTLSGGQTLVLQGMIARANNADTAIAWNANHTKDRLLELEPGANSLTVTGAASAALEWYDKWQ